MSYVNLLNMFDTRSFYKEIWNVLGGDAENVQNGSISLTVGTWKVLVIFDIYSENDHVGPSSPPKVLRCDIIT